MIGLALALVLGGQNMSQADLIYQGERIGRMSAAAGACAAIGYEVDPSVGERLVDGYGRAALASGWSEDVAVAAINSGASRERLESESFEPPAGASGPELRRFATAAFARSKERCHDLEWRYPGVIVDLERGDRNVDARLAIMLQPLDD